MNTNPRDGTGDRLVSVNLTAFVEQASVGSDPFRIDGDGAPYVPIGDGGIVIGLRLGDGVFDYAADHAAPGACLVHDDPAAGYALSAQACIGNPVEVRTGAAAGELGAIAGKRGEEGRVIAVFRQEVLHELRPGDQVAVRSRGQGAPSLVEDVTVCNVEPDLMERLPISAGAVTLAVNVRTVVPSRLVGNGIGRPTPMWDLDLQIDRATASRWHAEQLRLGDLVAIDDLDARYNAGYRRGWRSIGVVVHGASPQPGHGPGVTVILSGPSGRIDIEADDAGHVGLDEESLLEVARARW
jgi:hypothetical protein